MLYEKFAQIVREYPRKHAIQSANRVLSYTELNTLVDQICATLVQHHIKPGDRVAIIAQKSIEVVASIYACLKLGIVFVPVNPKLRPKQIEYIVEHSGSRCLISSASLLKNITSDVNLNVKLTLLTDLSDQAHITLGDAIKETTAPLTTKLDEAINQEHHKNENSLAALLYTSGSTGMPKGVMLSQHNLSLGASSVNKYLEHDSSDRILALLPLSFDYGLSQITMALSIGAFVVLQEYLLPMLALKAIEKHKITSLAAVPPMWQDLFALVTPENRHLLSSLNIATNSGGKLPLASVKKIRALCPQTKLYLMYGLTEAFRSSYLPPERIDEAPESMGQAIPNALLAVVDSNGEPVKPGEVGELVHAGPLVSMGYWQDEIKTKARFKPTPDCLNPTVYPISVWSGDKVRIDENGLLYFVSRDDEMIKSSGYRISPTEIEEVIYQIPTIKSVFVVGCKDTHLGQKILAVAACDGNTAIADAKAAIESQCATTLPNYMQPHAIELIDTLPTNANGKIDRASLTKMYYAYFENNTSD